MHDALPTEESWLDEMAHACRAALGKRAERILGIFREVERSFGGERPAAARAVRRRLLSSTETLPSDIKTASEARDRQFERLFDAISPYDATILISALSVLSNVGTGAENHGLIVPGRYDREVELLSAALTHAPSSGTQVPDWDAVISVLWQLRSVFALAEVVHTLGGAARPMTAVDTARSRLRDRAVSVRGTHYGVITRRLQADVTKTLQGEIVRQFGFGLRDVEATIGAYAALWERRVFSLVADCQAPPVGNGKDDVNRVLKCVTRLSVDEVTRRATLAESLPEWIRLPTGPVLDRLLDRLSTDLSDTEPPTWRGVLTESPLFDRPLLRLRSGFTIPLPARLVTEGFALLDGLLSSSQLRDSYFSARAAAVDRVIESTVHRVLRGGMVGRNLHYKDPETGHETEMDVLATFEDVAMVFEGKGRGFSRSALRGAPSSLQQELKKTVGKSTEQACKRIRYIAAEGEARFWTTTGSILMIRASEVRRYYTVVPTLTPTWSAALDGKMLREAGIGTDGALPIVTSLDVVYLWPTLLARPEVLIAYLDFREFLLRRPWIIFADEYEILGAFLNAGRFSIRDPRRAGRAVEQFHTPEFQVDFDLILGHDGSQQARPEELPFWLRLKTSPIVEKFITELSSRRPPRWVAAASAALRTPLASQEWLTRAAQSTPLSGSRRFRPVVLRDTAHAAAIIIFDKRPLYELIDDALIVAMLKERRFIWLLRSTIGGIRLLWACDPDVPVMPSLP